MPRQSCSHIIHYQPLCLPSTPVSDEDPSPLLHTPAAIRLPADQISHQDGCYLLEPATGLMVSAGAPTPWSSTKYHVFQDDSISANELSLPHDSEDESSQQLHGPSRPALTY